MLVLRRNIRQRVIIHVAGKEIIIEVNDIQRNGVKLAFQADRDVIINREEVDGRINFLAPKE